MEKPAVDLKKIYERNPEIRDAAKLRGILDKERAIPNIVTIAEFEQYVPIFQHQPEEFPTIAEGNRYAALIHNLTKSYCKRFNLYKETHIIVSESDPTVVLVMPPTFVTMDSIKHDAVSEQAVSDFFKNGNSEIPAKVLRAEAGLLEAIRRAVQDPVNKARRNAEIKSAAEKFDTFMAMKYPNSHFATKQIATSPTSTPSAGMEDLSGDVEEFL